ncbi:MAG: methylcrotonoyl-CoA carboxylase [Chitinophagaceae bacterium]|nr:methylcrotonoyl-CoA carboxylase [Chitinophagaceae bacterium]
MDIEFNKNEDSFKSLCFQLKERLKQVALGGGEKKIQSEHEKGKLTARERINLLLDADAERQEIAAFAADNMYKEYGGCPSAGVVVVIGNIEKKKCIVVANDATVKAGAWFPMTAKKNLRAQEIAMENNIPIIYLVDSAGVFLPLQNEVFPDKEHFGRIFRNNAKMSAAGIPQIAAIMGSCVAGGAYLPIMSDDALIVDKTGSIFLAGSYLVKAAIGEDIDNESLGGATTHSEISGVTDYKCANDQECISQIRKLVAKIGDSPKAGYNRVIAAQPTQNPQDIYGILPIDRTKPYDMLEIIRRLVDHSEFEQYKELYGQSILCGYARIDGWAVGIVANQRKMVKTKKNEVQMGGVIYSDSADKAARFIMNCNQKKIPLVFLQDVTGFMVGSRSEQGGIIKDGAKMVNAMANSVVPKFTILIGNSFGAGNYAMCGKAFDPRLIVSWPTAQMAVMSGASASKTLLQIKVASLKSAGKTLSPEDEKNLLAEIQTKYDQELSPYYSASQLWIDAIIDPLETRKLISIGIEIANNKPIEERFNVGVIQT